MGLVSIGSAYYHWKPTSERLVWDRLPMTIAFMSIYYLVMEETMRIDSLFLLIFFIVVGVSSVIIWKIYNDLRFYIIV